MADGGCHLGCALVGQEWWVCNDNCKWLGGYVFRDVNGGVVVVVHKCAAKGCKAIIVFK